MQHLKDEELMCSYQRGEIQAMDELLRRYRNPVYHFALRLSRNDAEAQDIAAEVFFRVHQYKDAYRPTGRFSTWLFSIAHHSFVSRLRKKRWLVIWPAKVDDPQTQVEFQSPDPSPQETAVNNELSETVQRCIQGLPFLQKEALILREYQKLEYQEIATILKKSLGTVKTLIHRARQNLKVKLLPYMEESTGGSNV